MFIKYWPKVLPKEAVQITEEGRVEFVRFSSYIYIKGDEFIAFESATAPKIGDYIVKIHPSTNLLCVKEIFQSRYETL